jgi:Dyp-type peroxidase family
MPDLDLHDIQGNILAGFHTNIEIFVGLTVEGTKLADISSWLVRCAPDLTTVAEVQAQRQEMKAMLIGEASEITWLCIGIGAQLLASLRPDIVFFDDGFVRGLVKRAGPVLGDRTDPTRWLTGGSANRIDVLLIVASNDELLASARADELIAGAMTFGLTCTYRETARRIADLEHFGFRDGISQPAVRGFNPNGTLAPGHFIFGYERFFNEPEFLPAGDPGGFLRNGSFLVFRRLTQDVSSFKNFCITKAADLGGSFPGMTDRHLAALLVGRWPSGAPVSMDVGDDPGPIPDEDSFDFGDDPDGRKCPFGAHIRKVNPRSGPKDVVHSPRLLRRGIPFGPAFDVDPAAERGLAFVSFQTSIEDQFEFLTGRWMNSPVRPAPSAGHDLLVGRSRAERSMSMMGPNGKVEVSDNGRQWITPTGGGYLFAPGRSALSRIGQAPSRGVIWRTQRMLSNAKGLLQDLVGR